MTAAPTNQTFKGVADFRVRGVRVAVQQRFRRQYPAVQAIPTLKRLVLQECLLNWMRISRGSESFKSKDLLAGRQRNRHTAGSNGPAVKQYRACAALSQPATKP